VRVRMSIYVCARVCVSVCARARVCIYIMRVQFADKSSLSEGYPSDSEPRSVLAARPLWTSDQTFPPTHPPSSDLRLPAFYSAFFYSRRSPSRSLRRSDLPSCDSPPRSSWRESSTISSEIPGSEPERLSGSLRPRRFHGARSADPSRSWEVAEPGRRIRFSLLRR